MNNAQWWREKRSWAVALTAAAGAVLLIIGLLRPEADEPQGWKRLDAALEEALIPVQQEMAGAGNEQGSKKISERLPDERKDDPGNATDAAGGGKAASAAAGGGSGDRPAGGPVWSGDGRLNINYATAEQLDELPGIGPAKAKAIVADRERNGLFQSVDDMQRVKGVGPKMLEKMRSAIVAEP
ncbi:ComEA family DNA-binding protein [Paenibacillus beijingensis]|uniref:ComEA family DNA-binding protein n=1 Tax=Paenibacillus beijingensis TaxID=1126833 RepID=UPI00069634E9|nr:ComEA family DNA-binding protein [Paenibacillus beijingensis]